MLCFPVGLASKILSSYDSVWVSVSLSHQSLIKIALEAIMA